MRQLGTAELPHRTRDELLQFVLGFVDECELLLQAQREKILPCDREVVPELTAFWWFRLFWL